MACDGLDIVLKERHILKDCIIDALEHIVRRGALGQHLECIIDKAAS